MGFLCYVRETGTKQKERTRGRGRERQEKRAEIVTIVGVSEECNPQDPQDQSQLSHACALAKESLSKKKQDKNLTNNIFSKLTSRHGL